MIFRRLPASSSFVLAAARLRALQPDPGRAARRPGHLRGRIQENSQPSPTARVATGPGPYALLTLVALMGAELSLFVSTHTYALDGILARASANADMSLRDCRIVVLHCKGSQVGDGAGPAACREPG